MYKIPVIHKTCGGIYCFFLSETGVEIRNEAMRSKDVLYVDGTQPAKNSELQACPSCGGNVERYDLYRQFDKKELVRE